MEISKILFKNIFFGENSNNELSSEEELKTFLEIFWCIWTVKTSRNNCYNKTSDDVADY